MADIALRQLQIIDLLTRHRYGTTLEQLQEVTRDLGIDISERTLQRDLQEIADVLPVQCERNSDNDGKNLWHMGWIPANDRMEQQQRQAANDSHWHPTHEHAE